MCAPRLPEYLADGEGLHSKSSELVHEFDANQTLKEYTRNEGLPVRDLAPFNVVHYFALL